VNSREPPRGYWAKVASGARVDTLFKTVLSTTILDVTFLFYPFQTAVRWKFIRIRPSSAQEPRATPVRRAVRAKID
jgi:hypothetical protein